jgi:hypothetical protein
MKMSRALLGLMCLTACGTAPASAWWWRDSGSVSYRNYTTTTLTVRPYNAFSDMTCVLSANGSIPLSLLGQCGGGACGGGSCCAPRCCYPSPPPYWGCPPNYPPPPPPYNGWPSLYSYPPDCNCSHYPPAMYYPSAAYYPPVPQPQAQAPKR